MRRRVDVPGMRSRLAAVVIASVLLVAYVRAPVLPVMVGATLAYAWLLWRSLAQRRGQKNREPALPQIKETRPTEAGRNSSTTRVRALL